MAIYGESLTIQYVAWDTTNNSPKTGDAANHTLRWVKDGTAAAPTNSPSEVDATNAPGVYKLTLTASETQCWVGTLCGKSSSSGVVIMPITLTFERLPTAAPGDTNGLPIIGVAPLTNLDAKISEVKAQTDKLQFVGTDVKATLDNEAVIVGAYATNMSPSEQIQSLGYTSARAEKLDNLDAAISSRLDAGDYIAPDNASIAAIKGQTDKLTFDSSNNVYAIATVDVDEQAIADAVASQLPTSQVVVQPLDVGPIAYTPDGGTIEVFTYSRILASWMVRDTDLVGHDLRFIVFSQSDPATKKAESAGGEITITMQDTHSLVSLNAAERALPAGPYGWVLRDQTLDTVLLRGKLIVKAAPDAD